MAEDRQYDMPCYFDGYSTPPPGPARRRPRARRRKRFWRRGPALCLCAACLLFLTEAFPALSAALTQMCGIPAAGAVSVSLGGAWSAGTRAAIEALAAAHPEAQAMLDDPGQWPEEVAALAARNEEALAFVFRWPQLKDAAPPETVDGAARGEFPLLLQWDDRWGCTPYGGGILAVTGCGPTALSIAACGLLGEGAPSPAAIAAWAQARGYAGENGTRWDLMRTGCTHFGLRAEELSLSADTVFGALEAGHPIICSVRPGDFTTAGHFIVLTGVEDGQIRVADPNSPANSAALWDYERLAPQIKNLWAYSA